MSNSSTVYQPVEKILSKAGTTAASVASAPFVAVAAVLAAGALVW